MLAEPVLGNAIPYVASALVPGAMFTLPMPSTLARPDIVGWRMRCVVVIGHVLVCWMVMRLVDFRPVRLVVLRRMHVVPWFRMVRMLVVRMLRRSLVVVVSCVMTLRTTVMFILMILGTAMVVVVVSMLSHGRKTCA
jgi:hypothetical protein